MSLPSSRVNFKVPFDSLTLRAVVVELRSRVLGGQVQDVRQPSSCELRIGIRSQGRNEILALSCDAQFARAHLTVHKSPNAAVPPAFCMAVRKHCEGAVIRDIRQRAFDRILEIEIGSRSAEMDSAVTVLIAELMGKHSNLILVSAEGITLEAAKRVSHRINRVREVLPGVPYQAPPHQGERLDPLDPATPEILAGQISAPPAGLQVPEAIQVEAADMRACDMPVASMQNGTEYLAKHLVDTVAGMSPFLAQSIVCQLPNDAGDRARRFVDVWSSIFGAAREGLFKPVAICDGDRTVAAYPFPPAQIPPEAQRRVRDLNAALDHAFTGAVTRAGSASLISELRGQIERDRKRLLRQKQIAERTLHEASRADEYKQTGELILANLWQIAPGAATIAVQDYFDPELRERTIQLDPKLSAGDNAEAQFKRYRKIRDGQATAEARNAEASAQLERLDSTRARLAALDDARADAAAEIAELRTQLRGHGLLSHHADESDSAAATGPDLQGHKIRRYTTPDGYEIYLGETATANDYLTTRLAASNDLWMHVRASTSAHVVIKSRGKPESVPRSVIEYAAVLCARHSSQKHSGLVPVDYTLKKHVRKPRGAAPGSADYHHETTLHVTP